jgi:hypothetical protein
MSPYTVPSLFFVYAKSAQNDVLMWLMSEAKGVEKSLEGLTRRMLLVNFVSFHTTANVSCLPRVFSPHAILTTDDTDVH